MSSVREYAILYVGGRRVISTVNGGASIVGGGLHKLDGPEHLAPDDGTRLDATADRHGLLPKLSGDAGDALLGDGTWGAVSGAPVEVLDEGSSLTASVASIDFVGAGVVATTSGDAVTVTISGASVADILDIPTAETDTSLVLAPDGAGAVEWVTPSAGPGGAPDPVADVFGTPDTAFEFASSSLTGLTAMGSATVEDADTTLPDHYFVHLAATATYNWVGRYLTPPATPFTAIIKLTDNNARANYNAAGMFIGVASPGNMDVLYIGQNLRNLYLDRATPIAFGTQVATRAYSFQQGPVYLAIVGHSSTSYDYLFSWGGYVWGGLSMARNPGITIATLGIVAKVENASTSEAAAWDYLRIWNSAKTFPGI